LHIVMIGLPLDLLPDVLEHTFMTENLPERRLGQLGLVNSTWTQPAQRRMYRDISVWNNGSWIRLLDHLELFHHLRRFVKRLSLYHRVDLEVFFADEGPVTQSHIPELLPCVEELSVESDLSLLLVPLLPALLKLELQDSDSWVIGESPFDAALWPSTMRSVCATQWKQTSRMLEWLSNNPAVNPIITADVAGLPSDLPRFCSFLEEHPTIEYWGVAFSLDERRVVYGFGKILQTSFRPLLKAYRGTVCNHVFRGHHVRALSLSVLWQPHSDMLNLPFGLLRVCEFPALRTLQLVFDLYQWAHDGLFADIDDDMPLDMILDPFDADDPTDDERWILPKGMALALTNVQIGFIQVDDVLNLHRLVGLLGAAFRPGVVQVEMSDKYSDRRRTFEFCTASMDPARDYLANH
jgi:hypothetical protein